MPLVSIDDIFTKIENLPTIPSLILEINNINPDGPQAAAELDRLTEESPTIKGKLLKVINTIYYSYPDPIASASEAVAAIDFELVRNMLLSVAFIATFPPGTGKALNHREYWLHIATTAHICRDMAEAREDFSEEETRNIFLAATFHDLGILVLESCYPEEYKKLLTACLERTKPYLAVEQEIFQGISHTTIGKLVANHWNCPSFIADIAEFHHEPERYTDGEFNKMLYLFHAAHFVGEVTKIGHFKQTPTQPLSWKALDFLGIEKTSLKEEAMKTLEREGEVKELLAILLAEYTPTKTRNKRR